MAKLNPVRGNYMLQGLDLVRAGIKAGVFILESNGATLPSIDPRTERWVTSRAVTSAAAKAGIDLNMSAVPAAEILAFLQQDPKAKVRTTEEQIVHMLGGDSPENRAFAQAELAVLEANYAVGAATAAA